MNFDPAYLATAIGGTWAYATFRWNVIQASRAEGREQLEHEVTAYGTGDMKLLVAAARHARRSHLEPAEIQRILFRLIRPHFNSNNGVFALLDRMGVSRWAEKGEPPFRKFVRSTFGIWAERTLCIGQTLSSLADIQSD